MLQHTKRGLEAYRKDKLSSLFSFFEIFTTPAGDIYGIYTVRAVLKISLHAHAVHSKLALTIGIGARFLKFRKVLASITAVVLRRSVFKYTKLLGHAFLPRSVLQERHRAPGTTVCQ